jgi:hypothetical protein
MEEYPHLVSVGVSTKPFGWHSLVNLSRLKGPVDNEANGIASTTAGEPRNSDVIQLIAQLLSAREPSLKKSLQDRALHRNKGSTHRFKDSCPLPPRPRPGSDALRECLEAGELLADHQGVDLLGPLVGDHGLEVRHVAHDRVLERDAVRAEDPA